MSDTSFFLEIVTPEEVIISGEYESAELPGSHGEFQVLPGHTPFLTNLNIGTVTLLNGTKKTFVSISGGYCEVLKNKTTIIAHTAETADKIDIDRAEAAEKRARKRLSEADKDTSIDEKRAKLALMRALNRLNAAKME